MNDDRTNIIVSRQCGNLVFGDWASAAIFVPRRVWIGDKLLHHLLRCYFRAVLGEHRPQNRQQLYSDAWLIWSAREVNRRPTCLLGPTTTGMLVVESGMGGSCFRGLSLSSKTVPWGPFCSVKMARQILEGLGLEIAKPDEARDILALRGPDKVPF